MYTECAIAIENVHRMTRSHATIDVRRIRPDVREFRDKRMMGSEVAHRVQAELLTGLRMQPFDRCCETIASIHTGIPTWLERVINTPERNS